MIDVVQYRFRIGTYQGTGAKGRGPGRIHFSGQFRDSSMFNPYNRSESILFYTLDTTSGVWMANLLHSPMKHINLAFFTFITALASATGEKDTPGRRGAKPPDSIEQGAKPPVR